jgi:uncharacterized protein (DUF433 family)
MSASEIAEESKRELANPHVKDPDVLLGKPVIKGTRLAVEFLVELLAENWAHEQTLQNYSQLTAEDIQAALDYTTEVLKPAEKKIAGTGKLNSSSC